MSMSQSQLEDAAFEGDIKAVKEALLAGLNINAEGSVWNPLHAAIENDQFEVVILLVENGANIECRHTYSKLTPLAHAVDILIDRCLQNDTPILMADFSIIDYLVRKGARLESGIEVADEYMEETVKSYLSELGDR